MKMEICRCGSYEKKVLMERGSNVFTTDYTGYFINIGLFKKTEKSVVNFILIYLLCLVCSYNSSTSTSIYSSLFDDLLNFLVWNASMIRKMPYIIKENPI